MCKRALSGLFPHVILTNKTGDREEDGRLTQLAPPVPDHPCVHKGEGCDEKITGFKRLETSNGAESLIFCCRIQAWHTKLNSMCDDLTFVIFSPNFRPPASLLYTSMEFYGTSEFWYTMRDVLRMGGAYSAKEFEKKSKEFCKTEWRLVHERFTKKLYTYADLFRLRYVTFCVV